MGKSKHGDDKSCYAIVTINHETDLNNPASLRVQFEYVNYEIKKVIHKIHSLKSGNAYDEFLNMGK